jgi:hypothetical protein
MLEELLFCRVNSQQSSFAQAMEVEFCFFRAEHFLGAVHLRLLHYLLLLFFVLES